MESLDRDRFGQPGTVARERVVRPSAHLHAAVVDDVALEILAREQDRRTIELPPLGTLVGALLWALAPAVALFSLVNWEAAAVAGPGGFLLWVLNRRVARSSIRFADGFVQYRDETPVSGIREDDDVRWQWGRR